MIWVNHFYSFKAIAIFSLILASVVVPFNTTPSIAAESEVSNPLLSNMKISGYIENESAVWLHPPQNIAKFQNALQLEFKGDIGEWGNYKVLTWAMYDAKYDFYPDDYPDKVKDEYGSNFTADNASDQIFREVYLDIVLDTMDIRLGKQQVVWGEAIGLRITDFVNPMDFREFILDDFIDSRIPIWATKLTYYIGDFDLTGLWIPSFEPDRPALDGSDWMWTFNRIEPPDGMTVNIADADEPDLAIENSEFGFRLGGLLGGWNMSLMYLYAWDDRPTRHVRFNPEAFSLDVNQRYHRLPMAGFTLANAFGSFVPRMELAYYQGKYFNTSNPSVEEGIVEKDYAHYMIGTDYSHSDHQFNVQFIQRIIFDYENDIFEDRILNSFSFWWQANYLNDTLRPELLIIYEANYGSWLIRPKSRYEITDRLSTTLGFDILTGPSQSFFGQFDDNDRIYLEVKYSF